MSDGRGTCQEDEHAILAVPRAALSKSDGSLRNRESLTDEDTGANHADDGVLGGVARESCAAVQCAPGSCGLPYLSATGAFKGKAAGEIRCMQGSAP